MFKSTTGTSLSAFTLSLALLLGPAIGSASPLEQSNRHVSRVRAYADGTTHVFFPEGVSATCGNYLRVSGAGTDRIVQIALTAALSNRPVTVLFENSKDGNFCNLTDLELN